MFQQAIGRTVIDFLPSAPVIRWVAYSNTDDQEPIMEQEMVGTPVHTVTNAADAADILATFGHLPEIMNKMARHATEKGLVDVFEVVHSCHKFDPQYSNYLFLHACAVSLNTKIMQMILVCLPYSFDTVHAFNHIAIAAAMENRVDVLGFVFGLKGIFLSPIELDIIRVACEYGSHFSMLFMINRPSRLCKIKRFQHAIKTAIKTVPGSTTLFFIMDHAHPSFKADLLAWTDAYIRKCRRQDLIGVVEVYRLEN